jgi:hypothetical protein
LQIKFEKEILLYGYRSIGSNLKYKLDKEGWIHCIFNPNEIVKLSSITGKNSVVSTNHTNFNPFHEFRNLGLRFNIYINPETFYYCNVKEKSKIQQIGPNLYYWHVPEDLIEITFNPLEEIRISNTGKSIIVAELYPGNSFCFCGTPLQASISTFFPIH